MKLKTGYFTTAVLLVSSLLLSACSGGSSRTMSPDGSSSGTQPQPPSGPDETAPSIVTTLPESNSTGASTATTVFVTFDETLDESSINDESLILTDQGVPVAGEVDYDATYNRLSFTPDSLLSEDTVYGVTVANTLQDTAGNLFPGHDWFFTSGDAFNLGATSQLTIDMCMDEGDLQMLTLVNNARAVSRDCGTLQESAQPPLAWNCLLDQAASGHSISMADNDFHAHVSPIDNSTPGDRITATGYNPQAWGENIAAGYPDEDAVVAGWLESPGHCSNIMEGLFTEMGAGVATNPASTFGIYWTQKFGRP